MTKKIFIFFNLFIIFLFLTDKKEDKNIIYKNIKITEIEAFNIDFEIKNNFLKKNLTGEMFIKNDNFRVFIYNKQEKRIDIGFNEKYFWYWSIAEEPNTLFYSDSIHANLVLKDCYNPSWMFKVLKNMNKIGEKYDLIKNNKVISKATILENNKIRYELIEEGIIITIKIKNALNKKFDESVFIIPKNFKYLNKMIPKTSYLPKDFLIASCLALSTA